MIALRCFLYLLVLMALHGCGNRGDLYLEPADFLSEDIELLGNTSPATVDNAQPLETDPDTVRKRLTNDGDKNESTAP